MSTTTQNRRRQTRHPVPAEKVAFVEIDDARASRHPRRLPVVNLSASGLSFVLDPESDLPRMEEGTKIANAAIRIGECTVRGDLVVMHVTPRADSLYVCGSLFYPATDTDLVKLRSVIAGMEVAGTD